MANEHPRQPPGEGPFLGALLRRVWQWVQDRIVTDVAAAGFDDLRRAHLQVFRFPTLDGVRPTEIAAELQISKQAVNELLGHMERSGYLVREPDPADGRARVVRLTRKGRRLERTARASARAAERSIAERLGAGRNADLWRTLERLNRDLARPEDASDGE